MSNDPRYFDLGPMIREAGIDWNHLESFLRLTTLHPFSRTFSTQLLTHQDRMINDVLDSYGCDIVIYDFKLKDHEACLAETSATPLTLCFEVHVGAIGFFCQYLGLKKIPVCEAVTELMTGDNRKVLTRPHIKKTDEEIDTMLTGLKELYSEGSKISSKKLSDRRKMFACIIDTDQEITRQYFA